MNIIVSQEIESVCPTFVGTCVEAKVENSPYCQELWDEITATMATNSTYVRMRNSSSNS